MYEQGTFHYIQVERLNEQGELTWQDAAWTTGVKWRSHRFATAQNQIAEWREAHEDEETRYRIVRRTFLEQVVEPWGSEEKVDEEAEDFDAEDAEQLDEDEPTFVQNA